MIARTTTPRRARHPHGELPERVGNYVSVKPLQLGNSVSADTVRRPDPHRPLRSPGSPRRTRPARVPGRPGSGPHGMGLRHQVLTRALSVPGHLALHTCVDRRLRTGRLSVGFGLAIPAGRASGRLWTTAPPRRTSGSGSSGSPQADVGDTPGAVRIRRLKAVRPAPVPGLEAARLPDSTATVIEP